MEPAACVLLPSDLTTPPGSKQEETNWCWMMPGGEDEPGSEAPARLAPAHMASALGPCGGSSGPVQFELVKCLHPHWFRAKQSTDPNMSPTRDQVTANRKATDIRCVRHVSLHPQLCVSAAGTATTIRCECSCSGHEPDGSRLPDTTVERWQRGRWHDG